MKQVILISCHPGFMPIEKFRIIKEQVDCDIFLLYNSREGDVVIPPDIPYFLTTPKDIENLGYSYFFGNSWIYPGTCNYPVLNFFKDHREYDFYWFLEMDVEFSGDWSKFFSYFQDDMGSDFIGSHVEKYSQENKTWEYWYVGNEMKIKKEDQVKGFNPICRYSRSSLELLGEAYSAGSFGMGHSEVFITSVLYSSGLILRDFGGKGEFVWPGDEERFYMKGPGVNNGSLRFRPLIEKEEMNVENKLYHPLKEFD